MNIKDILKQSLDAGESREYIPLGTHRLKCTGYEFLDGKGHTGAVGPAFKFSVVESTDPTAKGKTVNRMVRLNPSIADKTKLAAALKFRNNEILSLVNGLTGDSSSLEEVFEVLPKTAELAKVLVGSECVCACVETLGKDGKTYSDLKFGPVTE